MRPLRRNPEGRGFPGDLLCRAARPWGLPRASRRFAHLIPESLRRGHAGLMQRFPTNRQRQIAAPGAYGSASTLALRRRTLFFSPRHLLAHHLVVQEMHGNGGLVVFPDGLAT